jgi:S1-C subfamily serine protease
MKKSWCIGAVLVLACVGVSMSAFDDTIKLYKMIIHGVVYIVNYEDDGVSSGSGFLIDGERKLVVTNYHVVDDESEVSVYFPVDNDDDGLETERSYYDDRTNSLTEDGHHNAGRIIARDSLKDLAIVALKKLPDNAKVLELADDDPKADEDINMLGNPAGRPLWRWSSGRFKSIFNSDHTFKDGLHVDFKAIKYYADIYSGNSGGPLVNDDGKVIGIAEAGDHAGGISATAVHFSEIRDLLDTVESKRVISIENKSNAKVSYSIRWGDDGDWDDTEVESDKTMTHWSGSGKTPHIKFDSSFEDGYQEANYQLDWYSMLLGRGVEPSSEKDAMEYIFRPADNGVNLYKK